MCKLIFLKDRHDHKQDPVWYAIQCGKIERLKLADVYNPDGVQVGNADAGDHLDCLIPFEFEGEQYQPGIYAAHDNQELFDYIIEEDIPHTLYQEEVNGFTFHNGNRFQTIVTYSEDDSHRWEIEGDPALLKRFRTAITRKTNMQRLAGGTRWNWGPIEITQYQWQGTWEMYKIRFA